MKSRHSPFSDSTAFPSKNLKLDTSNKISKDKPSQADYEKFFIEWKT